MSYWFVPALPIAWLALRWYFKGKTFNRPDIKLCGKVVIVTGCNTGIGKETVLDLAQRGARVYMACRDYSRCEEARLDVIARTGNTNVFNRTLDLSSLSSVREFVDRFLQEETRLDILINNAGLCCPRRLTVDGYEIQMATNHLGPFLLTNLLLPTLIQSGPSRIVNVSSMAHYRSAPIRRDDLMNEHTPYKRMAVYAQTKLANVLFTRALGARLSATEVTANALHPGVVNTEFFRNLSLIQKILFAPILSVAKTAKDGAQTTLAVALDPAFNGVSGKYFDNSAIRVESKNARNDEMAEWLWQKSEELVGINTN